MGTASNFSPIIPTDDSNNWGENGININSNNQNNFNNDVVTDLTSNENNTANHTADTNNPHSTDKSDIGLDQVDNTSDLSKPISNDAQSALDNKADKVSGATNGNLATLDTNGNLLDSGSSISDFATSTQGALADSAVQPTSIDTLTNKTIDADNNTISNIETDNFKATSLATGTADNDKIPTKGNVDDSIVPIVNTDETVKITSNDTVSGYLNGKIVEGIGIDITEQNDGGNETLLISSPDTVWGDISGTLSNQTDLQTELDTKADINGDIIEEFYTKALNLNNNIINVNNSKILSLTDNGSDQYVISVSDVNITVPNNSSVAFTVGSEIIITKYNTGNVTIIEDSSVTINTKDNLIIDTQYDSVILKKTNTDEWLLKRSRINDGDIHKVSFKSTSTETNTVNLSTPRLVRSQGDLRGMTSGTVTVEYDDVIKATYTTADDEFEIEYGAETKVEIITDGSFTGEIFTSVIYGEDSLERNEYHHTSSSQNIVNVPNSTTCEINIDIPTITGGRIDLEIDDVIVETITTPVTNNYIYGVDSKININVKDIILGGWGDIDNATYSNNSYDTFANDLKSGAFGITFKPDGTKMYIGFSDGEVIYQYTLSTPWIISTASYDSVSYSLPYGALAYATSLLFNSTGTTLFIMIGNNAIIHQYSLTTPWDISTLVDDSISFSFTTEDPSAFTSFIDPTGTILYSCGYTGNIYQYILSTPWDLSTISYDNKSFNFGTGNPFSINVKPDGTKSYVMLDDNSIHQYTMSTPWDISTLVNDSKSLSLASEMVASDFHFGNNDGDYIYVSTLSASSIYQYNVSSTDIFSGSIFGVIKY